jgi:hypothetical protein
VQVTNRNSLFKDQARYLVERQDEALWMRVRSSVSQLVGYDPCRGH